MRIFLGKRKTWVLLTSMGLLVSPGCATQECACQANAAPPGLLTPGAQASTKPPQANEDQASQRDAMVRRHDGAYLLNDQDLTEHLGQRVLFLGQASNTKLGAAVVTPHQVVYCPELPAWPDLLLGRMLEVSGVLGVQGTRAEVSSNGLVSQGTQDLSFLLKGVRYHVAVRE